MMTDSNLTITVFGGSGFLGAHVSDQLSESGHNVRIFDLNESPWLRDDQEMIVGDILDAEAVSSAIKGSDIVYNFAAIADLNDALNQPLRTMHINVLGNVNVLEGCKINKIININIFPAINVHALMIVSSCISYVFVAEYMIPMVRNISKRVSIPLLSKYFSSIILSGQL